MTDRIERLKADAAGLRVTSSGRRDGAYQVAGAVAMGVGVVLALVAYQISLKKSDNRDILSLIILAVGMLTLTVAGAAVFLRYSLARFLRFWLLRQLVEGQEHIDQIVRALPGSTLRLEPQEGKVASRGNDLDHEDETKPPVSGPPSVTG